MKQDLSSSHGFAVYFPFSKGKALETRLSPKFSERVRSRSSAKTYTKDILVWGGPKKSMSVFLLNRSFPSCLHNQLIFCSWAINSEAHTHTQ